MESLSWDIPDSDPKAEVASLCGVHVSHAVSMGGDSGQTAPPFRFATLHFFSILSRRRHRRIASGSRRLCPSLLQISPSSAPNPSRTDPAFSDGCSFGGNLWPFYFLEDFGYSDGGLSVAGKKFSSCKLMAGWDEEDFEPAAPGLVTIQPKNQWDGEDMEDENIEESWEDEEDTMEAPKPEQAANPT